MIYNDWGFSSSPFQTSSLPANDLGERLLVGRDVELGSLLRRIPSGPKMSTVEGLNGVGKTSVVNVASYKLFRDFINEGKGSFVIPCGRIFQLNPSQDTDDFVDHVLREVAQTLIERAAFLVSGSGDLGVETLDRLNTWLNAPQLKSFDAGAFGFQFGRGSENNTSSGFDRSGFRRAVTEWLAELFPNPEQEGVICIIDNLELLQSSEQARTLLERLRDELFNIPGLRWVLCGALGIVFGIASSPRLSGMLYAPVEIKSIADNVAPSILTSRVDTFSVTKGHAYLPLVPDDFDVLYQVLNGNLRDVLGDADNFCQWVADRHLPGTDTEKRELFREWLTDRCRSAFESMEQEVRPRAMRVF